MTDLNLDAIEARANAATDGPWSVYQTMHAEPKVVDSTLHWPVGAVADVAHSPDDYGNANAEFIAHARADVPALVAEVRRLRDIEAEAYRRALDVIEAEREDETVALTDVGLVLAANAVRVLLNAAVTRGGAS